MKECFTKQTWEQWLSFSFAADKLIFHPQTAEDCGWKASVVGFYEVCVDSYCSYACMYI